MVPDFAFHHNEVTHIVFDTYGLSLDILFFKGLKSVTRKYVIWVNYFTNVVNINVTLISQIFLFLVKVCSYNSILFSL